ncbi:14 kDa phosphohistidine phosphatase-like [Brachionichthys hirsutus]|uniref:14 kDa phosphohistidine phosphatase-like n=1 Tax=Brachionichthys hirsutus TaxID=412623 RepID=UPI003604CCA2
MCLLPQVHRSNQKLDWSFSGLLCNTADIYDKVSEELEKGGLLDCECVGGGRIKHDPQAKQIHVYGYFIGFGRANHVTATEKLKAQYPGYEVTWDNEGY